MRSTAIEVVAVERLSSLAFLRAVLGAQAAGRVVMPRDPSATQALPGVTVTESVAVAPGGGWFTDRFDPSLDPAAAQISLTSGTTGLPKPVLLSHRALGDVTGRLVDVMRLDADVREYVGVPVTYSFGFGRIRAVAAAGGHSFLPERGFRVDELAQMLGRGEVNALSAVPTLLRLVLEQRGRFAEAGRALRWLEIGSQAITRPEKEALKALFPNARIIQHYGLTEASRTTFLDVSQDSGEALESVGQPTGAAEVKITEDGMIAIRGPHVADGIVTAEGVVPLTDADGWLVTRDLGRIEDGRLHFAGRADDLINVGGLKVPSELFEERLRDRVGADATLAVAPGADALRGQTVVVAHEGGDETALHDAARAVAAEFGIGEAFALLRLPEIPRTATGKVQRAAIGAAYEASPPTAVEPLPGRSQAAPAITAPPAAAIGDLFVAMFGVRAKDERQSFQSLGGDSLNYVMLLSELEPLVPNLPDDWDMAPIAELKARAQPAPAAAPAIAAPSQGPGPVTAIFRETFGDAAQDPAASFHSLGGDSLHYVMVLSALEERVPALPDEWDMLPISQLEALAGGAPAQAETPQAEREAIRALFTQVFGERGQDDHASFQSLGGDSLNYVVMLAELEKHLDPIPDDWDMLSIAALSDRAKGAGVAAPSVPVDAAVTEAPRPTPSARSHIPRNLDTVRTIAAVLVVAAHVVGVAPDEGLQIPAGSDWHRVMDSLDLIRMPLFTALAGFLYGAMPATRQGFAPYMKRRLDLLLWPLLFATLVFWVLRTAIGRNETPLLWAYLDGYMHLWYIYALLVIFAIVAFADTRLRPDWRGWVLIALAGAVLYQVLPVIRLLHLTNMLQIFPFFVFGILLYRQPALLRSNALLVASLLLIPVTVLIQQAAPELWRVVSWGYVIRWLCGLASVIVFLRLCPKVKGIEWLAAYTFTIYLWHPAANAAMRTLLLRVGLESTALLFVIGVAVGVLVPVVMHRVALRAPRVISIPTIGR